MATLFLGPTPQQSPLFSHRLRVLHAPPPAPATLLSDSALQRKLVYRCSLQSSSSSPSIAQEEEASFPVPPTSELDPLAEESDVLPLRGCKACGRKEVERGCNGEGRIQGGIATFPGFGWWPIKAYRPCPGFVSSGGRYRRRGQSMDEVAFGRGGEGTSKGT